MLGAEEKNRKKTLLVFFFKKSDYAHKQNLPAMEENRMVEFAGRQQTACKLAACSLQITRISTWSPILFIYPLSPSLI